LISRPYLPFGDVEAFAERVLSAVCCGQIAYGVMGPDVSPTEAVARIKGQARG